MYGRQARAATTKGREASKKKKSKEMEATSKDYTLTVRQQQIDV
jgi:hypothetical protein